MKFEEIFNEKGLYVADSFRPGVCFEIDGRGNLLIVTHENENDIYPERESAIVYKDLFNKEYKKVFTRQSLFSHETTT